jgi:V8-like Glu-specific endopeptidase
MQSTDHTTARRITGLAAVALIACATAIVPSAASAKTRAHAAQDTSGSVSSTPTLSPAALAAGRAQYGANATTQQVLQAYWTPDRMRAAKPVDSASFLTTAYQRFALSQAARQKAATTQATEGVRPPAQGPALKLAPQTAGKVASSSSSTTAAASAYNPNYNYWQPAAYTNGKVFFNMNGGSYQCSAAIVNTEGQDTVWTAGHCVNAGSGGQWATNWTFVPSYDVDLANPAPYGYWYANQLWSRSAWISSSDFTQDMGVAIMAPHSGWKIVAYFGGQGFAANIGKNVWENTFGYPAEGPFDGGHLQECWGTTSPEWSFLFWSSDTLKVSCDMTRGESGGPWLNGFNGSWGYLNGVNSRIDQIVGPTVTFSPYFNDNAVSLFNATRYL